MRKFFIALAVLGLSVALAAPAICDEPEEYGPGYGHGWGTGHMMHYGPRDWGMRGRGWNRHGRSRGLGPSARDWQSMKPEQQKKWDKMRSDYQIETLELRKQMVAKQMELETLWAQPNVDSKRVEKLSREVAELEAQLAKKRDKYLLQCRKEFGDQGWTCPGGGW